MFDQNTLPPLMVEALSKRYPKGVWLGMEPIEKHCKVFEYCDEYRSVGYILDDIYHVVEWNLVLPQSKDRARLDEALHLLNVAQNRTHATLNEEWVFDPRGGWVTMNDAIDRLLEAH